MLDIIQQKQALRKIFKERRASLTKEEALLRSQQINKNFIDNLLPKIYQINSKKVFSLYLASYKEVSTEVITQYFYQNNISFSYPKIVAQNHQLDFVLAQQNQAFVANKFFTKIIEPQDGIIVFPNIIILPLLAFDADLSRLGMGGGFFDRTIEFLKNRNSEIITIGLAYEFQRSERPLPIDNTDQKLDFIVTEKSIFSAS